MEQHSDVSSLAVPLLTSAKGVDIALQAVREESSTHQPLPEPLCLIPRWRFIIGVGLDLLQARYEVHILRLHQRRAVEPPRAHVEDREHREGQVVGDEGICTPVAPEEDRPARELSAASSMSERGKDSGKIYARSK